MDAPHADRLWSEPVVIDGRYVVRVDRCKGGDHAFTCERCGERVRQPEPPRLGVFRQVCCAACFRTPYAP